MLEINQSTITCKNTLDVGSNFTFRSIKTGFELNSFYVPGNDFVVTHDLEYYLYPVDCKVSIHYVKDEEYVSEQLTSYTNNEYCIVNDINYEDKAILDLIDILQTKYNKVVHYNKTKDSTFVYRLSRVLDIFPSCRNPLNAYFLSDYFFDNNMPKVIKIYSGTSTLSGGT